MAIQFNNLTGNFGLVGVSSTANTVTGVTWGGKAMTEIGTAVNNVTAGRFLSMWYVVAPPSDNSMGFTGGANIDPRQGIIYGVDISNPFTGLATNSGTSGTSTVNVTTSTGYAYVVGYQFSPNTGTAGAATTGINSPDYQGFYRSTTPVSNTTATLTVTQTSTEWNFKGIAVNALSTNLMMTGVGI